MPPSKKSMRARAMLPCCLQPPHNTDPKQVIEQFFLLRRFDEALELSYGVLRDMCSREEDEDRFNKGKQPAAPENEMSDPQEMIMRLKHTCKNPGICGCASVVVLVVQIMYEMGKSSRATPFVCKFYGDITRVPYDIIFVCVNLLANSLEDFVEAKRILLTLLGKGKVNEQGLVTYPATGRNALPLTSEQNEILFEFLLFHVLAPLNQTEEAISLLNDDKMLSAAKKEGWSTYLQELNQARLLKLQQASEASSHALDSCKPPTSVTGESHVAKKSNALMTYCSALLTRSRQATSQFWTFLITHRSKLGFLTFGVAVLVGAIYLLSSLRRRKAALRGAESDDKTAVTSSRPVNSSNARKPPPRTTKPLIRQQAGLGQTGQSGVWSSMTQLLSGALSLK